MASVLTNAITLLKQPHLAVSYGRWLASPMPAVTLPWGDRLYGFRSFSEYRSAILGVPAAGEIAFVRSALRQGGVAIDIGANLGAMTLLMAHSGASVVHAFEPSPGTAEVLARTVKSYASVVVHRAAMSDHVGMASFIDTPGASATNRLADGADIANAVAVHTDTIDAFCAVQRIQRVAFLKIDVEGFEPLVIRGAVGTLRERRAVLGMIEIIPQLLRAVGSSTRELHDLLAKVGYSIRNIEEDGSIGGVPDLENIHPTMTQNFALAPASAAWTS